MKRLSALALAAVLTMSILAGCGTNNNGTTGNVDNNGSGYTQNDGNVNNNGNNVTGDTDTGYDSDGDGILGNDPVGDAVDDITGNNGTNTNDTYDNNNTTTNNNGTTTNANNNANSTNR